ncbi:MAG: phosphate acyltransferase PlsX [Planctomycetota bacterium]|nr:phosphate acyltransferase PlsX [Planctomycetales bacterium]RLT03818.1 MAG: phosphate acyltransferase PlsX [Planctomycetota bacterium]
MRIALDAMGGDFAPSPNIVGAFEAVERNSDLEILLVGDPARLAEEIAKVGSLPQTIRIVESDGVVGMEEKPTTALREKPNCSIARCWQLMAAGEVEAVVSAGNTGAMVAAGLRTRLFLKGVKRPGIAVRMPTVKGSCVLLDVGANPAARAEHLAQYGLMGAVFARELLGVKSPRVGLLNIGSEEGKGTDLYRETHALLINSPIKEYYIGNVEGRDLYHGDVDVVICEGFVGNVVLKVSEGMAEFVLKTVGGSLMKSLTTERDHALQTLTKVTEQFHYQESGGAPLLGIDGICIICHGSSDHRSIRNALKMATEIDNRHINSQITELLSQQNS